MSWRRSYIPTLAVVPPWRACLLDHGGAGQTRSHVLVTWPRKEIPRPSVVSCVGFHIWRVGRWKGLV